MSSTVNTLVEMGFSKQKAELAVKRSGSDNVQLAMDWLLSHEHELDDQVEELAPTVPASEPQEQNEPVPQNSSASEEAAPATAKSIKCDDCGKLFSTSVEIEFHAAKSGHENFSESTEEKKQLTDEEKKEQLAKIEAKLRQRRLEREAREKEEALLKEKNRIKSGKEMAEAKKKHEELEMKKIVEQRKREKEEERLAKQRVRDQIEQDKLARKAKFGGGAAVELPTPAPQQQPVVAKQSVNYDQVKLQIRLTDGATISETFGAKEPLSAVRLYIEMHRSDGLGPFSLMVPYPRKVFSEDDYEKPLETLGLAPTATLIVSKH